MRTLTDHIVSGDQAVQLKINVTDEPGQGGANHEYAISWAGPVAGGPDDFIVVKFQNGPVKEFGVNGITNEAMTAIVIDRLRSLQSGPFPSREAAIALTHFEEGLMWLQRRTIARIKRGVEGTNEE